jgi:hypothetical protein
VFGATGIKNHFLLRSASLRAGLRRKEKGFSFLYPAFTSQRVRKTAPTLTRHAGLLSAAPSGLVRPPASQGETQLLHSTLAVGVPCGT